MESGDVGFVCRRTVAFEPPADIGRLVELAQIWAVVQFGHPWLADERVDWDAALVSAIPHARRATTDAAFVEVVATMLAALGDPRTRVLPADEVVAWPGASPLRTKDDALIVKVAGLSTFDRDSQLAIVDEIARASRIVFDLRGVPASMSPWVEEVFATFGPPLLTTEVTLPEIRTRVFHGYPGASASSGGYYQAFEISSRPPLSGTRNGRPPKTAFVVGPSQVLPGLALPLLQRGLAFVVASEPLDGRAFAPSIVVPVADRQLEVRVGDIAFEGRRPRVVADAVTDQDPIDRAVELLQSHAVSRRPRLEKPTLRPKRPVPAVPRDVPDVGHRMLSAIHMWSVLDRFHAYPELRPRWRDALAQALSAMDDASTWDLYIDVLLRLAAATEDGHSTLAGPPVSARFGSAWPPFEPSVVEGCLVVTEILDSDLSGKLEVGDVIAAVDGRPVRERWAELAPLVAASTPAAHRGKVAWRLLMGPSDVRMRLVVNRDGERIEVLATRMDAPPVGTSREVYRVLEGGNIGVADLTQLTVEQVPAMFDALAQTDAIVFDMRGYPHGTAWAIAPYLDRHAGPTPAAEFLRPLVVRGLREGVHDAGWATRFLQLLPEAQVEQYRGRTIMLIDHRTISQAEHTGLFFAAANGTRFVGSPTAGANGDVTTHVLPDGLQMSFTGQAVVPIDGRPLQRVGLQPHLNVTPTIAGIRSAKDEVLEAAVEWTFSAHSK